MVNVGARDIELVQAGITRLLIEGTGGATGTIIWHLGKQPGEVILEPVLKGTPAQVCYAQAVILSAASAIK